MNDSEDIRATREHLDYSSPGAVSGHVEADLAASAGFVEFRVGRRSIGTASLRTLTDGTHAFNAHLSLQSRAAVSAYLMPEGRRLTGSPLLVEPEEPSLPETLLEKDSSVRVEFAIAKRLVFRAGSEIALFVTHSRTGTIKPHVAHYLSTLRAEGVEVLLIVAADRPCSISSTILKMCSGAIVRRNIGYDFGAWAHAFQIYPELFGASAAYLLNDSIIGPGRQEDFHNLVGRIRASEADLIGLTQNLEYHWHLQSYFLVLKARILGSSALQDFLESVRPLTDKDEVIQAYELRFSPEMQRAGFRCEAMFDSEVAGNPTLKAWRTLLRQGFPFMKILMIAGAYPHIDTQGWREAMMDAGFDLALVDATLSVSGEVVPLEEGDRLLAHPLPFVAQTTQDARLSYFGAWHLAGPVGDEARNTLIALRALGGETNFYPINAPSARATTIAPTAPIFDFVGAPDIVIIDEVPQSLIRLAPEELRVLSDARRRIGIVRAGDVAGCAPFLESKFFDEIWTANSDLLAYGRKCGGTPIVALAELAAATKASEAESMADRVTRLLAGTSNRLPTPITPVPEQGVSLEAATWTPMIEVLALRADGGYDAGDIAGNSAWLLLAPAGCTLDAALPLKIAEASKLQPHVAIFYGDDIETVGDCSIDQIRLKPEFDLTLLGSQDYIGAPLLVRTESWRELGGLSEAMGTAAAADLLFRGHAAGLAVARIPEVLLLHPGRRVRAADDDYLQMLRAQPRFAQSQISLGRTPKSFAIRTDSSIALEHVTVIADSTAAAGGHAGAGYKRLLEMLSETDWPAEKLTVIIGDDGSDESDWRAKDWPFELRRVVTTHGLDDASDRGARLNRLLREVATEQVVILTEPVSPSDPGWLRALQTYTIDPTVGAVGARVLSRDGRLRYTGLVSSSSSVTQLWAGRLGDVGTYQGWSAVAREWSMVSGAVMATRVSILRYAGWFDERLPRDLENADLCLRIRSLGYRIVYQPDAELRRYDDTPYDASLLSGEALARFRKRWRSWLRHDPAWHPGLHLDSSEMQPLVPQDAWFL